MLRRSGGTVCDGEEISRSPTRISPSLGSTKPAIKRSVVVLPQPDGPSRQTRWPCSICSDISSTTAILPYRLVRPFNSTDATRILPVIAPLAAAFVIRRLSYQRRRLYHTANVVSFDAGRRLIL